TAESVLLRNGDRCFSNGQWVIWEEFQGQSQVGQVREVIQVAPSLSAAFGKADFALIRHCKVVGWDSHYDMPRVVLEATHSLVPISNIICNINVQHNCAARKCKIVDVDRIGREEQEKTTRVAKAVRHAAPDDLILNTAQMRNSAKLMPFWCPVQELDREHIIHLSAMQEVEAAKS
ncbi:hypothetical protein OH76DRAFT_1330032, partial [Lentinus brumalis]